AEERRGTGGVHGRTERHGGMAGRARRPGARLAACVPAMEAPMKKASLLCLAFALLGLAPLTAARAETFVIMNLVTDEGVGADVGRIVVTERSEERRVGKEGRSGRARYDAE